MKKNIIILESAAGARLSNQLWNFISIYAYCLERGFSCKNYSFFELKRQPDGRYSRCDYNNFFDLSRGGWLNRLMIACQINKDKFSQKLHPYDRYVNFIKFHRPEQTLYSDHDKTTVFYLPPTGNSNPDQQKQLELIEKQQNKNLYFSGWLFRNPDGLKKYYPQIKKYFQPRKKIATEINALLQPLRKKYEHIVGVHIRQTDYKTYDQGKYFFAQDKIKTILEQYLVFFKKDAAKTLFLLCSDGIIDKKNFPGLNIEGGLGGVAHDLFALSQTDFIIGSNSTFGAFAAYYGNIPLAVFDKVNMDMGWEKINPAGGFNYDNKCTLAHQ